MEAIGGYFSLELPLREEYHKDALRLNTGRNCLEYILRARRYDMVYIPYYTCEVILEPFKKLGIPYEFYHVGTNLEIRDKFTLNKNEGVLYTNYFGLKQRYVEQLAEQIGTRLIVDNTQAFYSKRVEGIDTFYTCRKFFGVPDGAYLYTDTRLDEEFEHDKSYDRFAHLLKRVDLSAEEGYADFHKEDDGLIYNPIRRMSKITHRMMQSIEYEGVAQKRRANYQILNEALGDVNNLSLTLDEDAVPMVYPFLVPIKGLREKLIENKIFVARYWPNVLEWTNKGDIDYLLAFQTVHLPVDQRYDEKDMNRIIDLITEYGQNSSI